MFYKDVERRFRSRVTGLAKRGSRPRTATVTADCDLWIAVMSMQEFASLTVEFPAITIARLSGVFRLPSLEMFDGDNPDAWIGPLVSDTVLGLLVPVMVYLAWRGTGPAAMNKYPGLLGKLQCKADSNE